MKKTFSLIALLALSGPAWAAGDPRPDWVDGASMQYPHEMYLTGVGFGNDRSSAQDKAVGEIAKVFSTVVTVDSNVNESESSQSGKKNTFSQSVSQSVRTASEKVLSGVEVVENWQDESSKQFYALALLDRAKGAAGLNDKIAELEAQISYWKSQLDVAKEKMARVKAAVKLQVLLKARSELLSELRVLDPDGETPSGSLNEAAVKPQAAKVISELDVIIDLSGKGSDEIETGIVNGLNSFGLQSKVKGKESAGGDIIIEGKVATNPSPGTDDRWKWARTTVGLNLKDGRTGKTFYRLDAADRQASGDYDEAVYRTYKALGSKVAGQLKTAITNYFEN